MDKPGPLITAWDALEWKYLREISLSTPEMDTLKTLELAKIIYWCQIVLD